jgi:hypothetical protein
MIEFLTADVIDAMNAVKYHPYTVCRTLSPKQMGEAYASLCSYLGDKEGLSRLVSTEVELQLNCFEGEALNPQTIRLIGESMEDYLKDHSASPQDAEYLSKRMIPPFLSRIRTEARRGAMPSFIRSRVEKTVRLYVEKCPLDITYPRTLGLLIPDFIDDSLRIPYQEDGDPAFKQAARKFIRGLSNYEGSGGGIAGGGGDDRVGTLFEEIMGNGPDSGGLTNRPPVSNLDPLNGFMIGWFGRTRPTFKA